MQCRDWGRAWVRTRKEKLQKVESENFSSYFVECRVLFAGLWIERDDFFQFFCQHLLHSCSCHPGLSSKPTVKERRKTTTITTNKTPVLWILARLLINFDFSLYFCIIVCFSESSSEYLFYAVLTFSCGQWDGLLSTYPILTSERISVTNICSSSNSEQFSWPADTHISMKTLVTTGLLNTNFQLHELSDTTLLKPQKRMWTNH